MADAPPTSSAPAEGAAGTFASRLVAAVTLLVPTAGLAWHAWAYLALEAEALRAYLRGPWLKAAALVAFVNLVATWLHYRRTRMKAALAARVLTYVWVISMVLLFRRVLSW